MLEHELTAAELAAWRAESPVLPASLALDSDWREALARAVGEPAASIDLTLRRGGEQWRLAGPMRDAFLMISEPAGSQPATLLAGTLLELPRLLAELVDLGPRPLDGPAQQLLIPAEVLDTFCGVGLSDEALADLRTQLDGVLPLAPLEAMLSDDAVRWTLTLTLASGETSIVDVIDAVERGLWSLDGEEEPAEREARGELAEPANPDAELTPVLATPIAAGALWTVLTCIPAAVSAAREVCA